jgi:hypothetical protein
MRIKFKFQDHSDECHGIKYNAGLLLKIARIYKGVEMVRLRSVQNIDKSRGQRLNLMKNEDRTR